MSRKIFILILVVAIVGSSFSGFIGTAAQTTGESFYVIPSGATNGDGTSWASPFSGFSNIQWGDGPGKVGSGDTLFISGGSSGATYNEQLYIGASGTEGNPITIKIDTQNPEHNGLVTIDLDKAEGKAGIFFGGDTYFKDGKAVNDDTIGKSYIVLDGYNPGHAGNIGINVTDTAKSGVLIGREASHNIIRYIEQSYATIDGIWFNRDGGYNLLEYCKAHHNTNRYIQGILLQSGDHNTVSYCESYDNGGSGFHTFSSGYDAVLDPTEYAVFDHCIGYRNGYALKDGFEHGIYLCGPSNYCTVSNSEFYQNGGAGIQIFSGTAERTSTGNIATNNLCYDNGFDETPNFGWGIVLAGFSNDATIENNILHDNKCHGLSIWDTAYGSVQGNTLYNNGEYLTGTIGADGDYTSSNMSLCDMDNNIYKETSDTEPLINWQGNVYYINTASTYVAASGKDSNSTFEITTEKPIRLPPPTKSLVPGKPGDYMVTFPDYNWIEADTGYEITDGTQYPGDEGTVNIEIPFDFTFYGEKYSSGTYVKAFSNGGISFDLYNSNLSSANSYTAAFPSDASHFQKMIAPWYTDIWNPGTPPMIYTKTVGSAPNRKFIIEWKDCQDAAGNTLNFEMILYETTNIIEFQYQTVSFARKHYACINKGDGVNGLSIEDARLGDSRGIRFTLSSYGVTFPEYNWIDADTEYEVTGGGDEGTVNIALPFDFTFYDEKLNSGTDVKAFMNGGISFDLNNSNLSAANSYILNLPSNASYLQKVISPFYTDIWNPAVPPKIYSTTVGTAPDRKFVIEWKDCQDAAGNNMSFELILYETTNAVEFQYQKVSLARKHTSGINKGDGINGFGIEDIYLADGRAVRFEAAAIPAEPTPTPTPIPSPSPTATPTPTPTNAPTPTPATTPVLENNVLKLIPDLGINSNVATAKVSTDLIEKAFNQAESGADGTKSVIIDICAVNGAKGYALEIPVGTVSKQDNHEKIEMKTPLATISIPGNMFGKGDLTNASKIAISAAAADISGLNKGISDQIGGRPVVELKMLVDGKDVEWKNNKSAVSVSIDYTPTPKELKNPDHIVVWYLDGNGKAIPVPNGKYDAATGKVLFTVHHFSEYAVAFVEKSFNDIGSFGWAKNQIEVLASKGIINGTSETSYSPGKDITRADFVTLLVKTLGLTASVDSNFKDISMGNYYYESVGIARVLKITNGTGDNTFSPNASITRQDMIVLAANALRAAGKLQVKGTSSDIGGFLDSDDCAPYSVESIAAMVKSGFIQGYGQKINPSGNATRAEVAVFLYNIYKHI